MPRPKKSNASRKGSKFDLLSFLMDLNDKEKEDKQPIIPTNEIPSSEEIPSCLSSNSKPKETKKIKQDGTKNKLLNVVAADTTSTKTSYPSPRRQFDCSEEFAAPSDTSPLPDQPTHTCKGEGETKRTSLNATRPAKKKRLLKETGYGEKVGFLKQPEPGTCDAEPPEELLLSAPSFSRPSHTLQLDTHAKSKSNKGTSSREELAENFINSPTRKATTAAYSARSVTRFSLVSPSPLDDGNDSAATTIITSIENTKPVSRAESNSAPSSIIEAQSVRTSSDSLRSSSISSSPPRDCDVVPMCVICNKMFRASGYHYDKLSISIAGLKRRFCDYFNIGTPEVDPRTDYFLRRERYPFCPTCFVLVNDLYRRGEQLRHALASFVEVKQNIKNCVTMGLQTSNQGPISHYDMKKVVLDEVSCRGLQMLAELALGRPPPIDENLAMGSLDNLGTNAINNEQCRPNSSSGSTMLSLSSNRKRKQMDDELDSRSVYTESDHLSGPESNLHENLARSQDDQRFIMDWFSRDAMKPTVMKGTTSYKALAAKNVQKSKPATAKYKSTVRQLFPAVSSDSE